MPVPFARAAHHLYRYFAGFLLILFILWGGWHVKGQLADLSDKESLHQYLLDKGAEQSKDISAAKDEAVKSAANWKKATNDELARQISQLSAEIEQKTNKVLALDNIANAINPSRQLEIARLNAEIALATQIRDYLLRIKEYQLGQTECSRITNNCETIRQRHVLDFTSYQKTVTQLVPLQESWQAQYNALSQEYNLRTNLEERRDALALKTQGHKADYAQCLASAQKDCNRKEPPPFALNSAAIDQAQANLQQITQKLGDELTRHWLKSAVFDPIRAVLPMAIQVFIAALLGKLGIKFLLYFVLAPRAAHGRAICLVPNACSRQTASLKKTQSQISLSVPLTAEDELLVHHGYYHSASTASQKGARWLLSYKAPLLSWLSGLFNVTTVMTDSTCEVTLSAGKYTLEELLPLELQDGEAVSIRASHLVGLVKRRNAPLQITRHWRLMSLQAWLTLQLRYVVFHGPATLILKGCRGVRIDGADGERAIEQNATIGFSAHLNYGTTRTETFRPYLFGDSELLLDRFTGQNGIYIYEEMPTSSEAGGVTGRRIGGALDALMKVVGL